MEKKLTLRSVDWVMLILLAIGGLNWGLVGLFEFDLVATIFGEATLLSNMIYILVGISALYLIKILVTYKKES